VSEATIVIVWQPGGAIRGSISVGDETYSQGPPSSSEKK